MTVGLITAGGVEPARGTPTERSHLPPRLRIALEQFGATPEKFGQTLSLRRESALRTLDPEFKVLDALLTRSAETMEGVLRGGAAATAFTRLKTEAALTARDLPGMIAAWLQREDAELLLVVRHEGLARLESGLDRTGNRPALAMVTLRLYLAASLLMLHSAGPRVFGDVPLFALLGYALAPWLSFRLVRAVARSGRL